MPAPLCELAARAKAGGPAFEAAREGNRGELGTPISGQRQREERHRSGVAQRHDVLMLFVDRGADGRLRGRWHGSNVSMITMRLPQ